MTARPRPWPRCSALACVLAAACSGDPSAAAPEPAPPLAANGGAPTSARGNPVAELGAAGASEYDATVVEAVAAGEYSYVELEPAAMNGERRWAVTLGEQPPVGALVHARVAGTKHDFESRRLQRRFDTLDFAALEIL